LERKVLRRIFGGIKVSESWRWRCNRELIQLFGDSDILTFGRISRLNWIGHVNRMNSKTKVSQRFKNNPQGRRLRGRPKHRWWNCVQTDITKSKFTNSERDVKSKR